MTERIAADFYKYAALATASYVRMGFLSRTLRTDGARFVEQAVLQSLGRLPRSLGESLFVQSVTNPDPWKILNYYGADAPEFAADKSGFGATLFERGGEKVLALRGTEPRQDGLVDLLGADIGQIGLLGLALTQVVSMVNLIQRMRADPGAPVVQVKVNASLIPSEGALTVPGVPPMFLTFSRYLGQGVGGIDEGETITVTGHSLGGHLAYMAARLFPGVVEPQIYVYNAAGYDPSTVNFFAASGGLGAAAATAAKLYLLKEFGPAAIGIAPIAHQLTDPALDAIVIALRGTGTEQGVPTVVNVHSEDLAPGDDPNILTSAVTGADKYGTPIDLPTEHNNHTIEPLTDALAMQALVQPWQSAAFDANDLIRVLDASANERARSYEEFAEGLFRLALKNGKFLDDSRGQTRDKLPTSNEFSEVFIGKGEISARDSFHDAVLRTQDALKDMSGLQILSLVNVPASSLAASASSTGDNGIAYRYALRALDPFVVLGPASLHEPHNTSERLVLHDLVNSEGAISDVWIQDRVAFLGWKNVRNATDVADGVAVVRSDSSTQSYVYTDKAIKTSQGQEYTLSASGTDPVQRNNPIRVIFGTDDTANSDELQGSTYADHLFGEDGDDILIGAFGNDYLEGGKGNDVYVYQSGDGFDTILDVDGAGSIAFDGVQLQSGERIASSQWHFTANEGGEFFYWLRNEKDGSTSLTVTASGTPGAIRIRGYRDGALGINLPDFTPDARPGGEMEIGTEGNDTLDDPFQLVKLALGGDDIVWGKPDSWLEGGTGNDWLAYAYSIGQPELGLSAFGGEGNDLVFGTAYDDQLHAEDVAQFAAFVGNTGSPEPGPEHEVLFGGAGDDTVAGGRGNDWVAGGIGSDVIYGGAGNDALSGAGEIFMELTSAPGLQPQAETIFNVHTSGRYDQTHPTVRINVPNAGVLAFGFTPADLGMVLREGLDESGWRDGADVIFAGAGDDEAWGGFGDDTLAGEAGDDILMGESGNDLLDGGDGDDHLVGGGGNDVLIGGAGADILEGGDGDDIYEVDASDTVRDGQGWNRIRFGADVRREALRATQFGTTLVLTGVAGGTVTIENGLAGGAAEVDIEYGSFRLGEFLSSIDADALDVQGGDADESVFGASGNDRITAGRGNDLVEGGAGDDVYILNLGDGFDVLTDAEGVNAVEFGPGIGAADITANVFFNFSTSSYDMSVGYGPADTVAIVNGPAGAIAEYRFADGTVLSHADVIARDTQGFTLAGTDGDDTLFGGGGNDSLQGGMGDDTLLARAGNDSVNGGEGNDKLVGGEGNDTLFGNSGDDALAGGSGDDVLVAEEGNDSLDGGEGKDLLEGGDGDDTLQAGPGNDVLRAGNGDDLLVGGAGDDSLEGGQGNDTYLLNGGDGADILNDIAGNNTIRFGIGITPESFTGSIVNGTDGGIYLALQVGPSDHLLIRQDAAHPGASTATFSFANGEDLTQGELMARTLSVPLDYVAGQNAVLLYGSRFDDRVLASPQSDFVDGGDGDDLLQGEGGNDVLIGGAGEDLLLGGVGDDALTGGAGSDTYALRRGMGRDTVTEDPADAGINSLQLGGDMTFADLAADRQGDNLYLHVKNARDGAVITDYFATANSADAWQIESAGGTITRLADVLADLEQSERAASIAVAYQHFEDWARTAYASALYGAGYTVGGDGRFRKETTFNGTFSSSHRVEDVGFSIVTQADDSLFFSREIPPLLLTGQTFSSSQTSQTIQVLNTAGSQFVPIRDGGPKYQPGSQPPTLLDVAVFLASGFNGLELANNTVAVHTGNVVTRLYSSDPSPQAEVAGFRTFSPGTVPTYTTQTITHFHQESSTTWEMQIAEITGGDSDNMIDGGSGFSLVDGGAGNDLISARGVNFPLYTTLTGDGVPGALLYGNAGDDELRGTDLDDVLIGGAGNDTMQGGAGNDTYLIFSGDGSDLIFDDGATVSGVARENIVEMPEGVSLTDLTISYATALQAGRYSATNHAGPEVSPYIALDLSWAGGVVRIVVPHTDQNAGMGIDAVRLADGSSATLGELFALAGGMPDLNPHNLDNTDAGITWGAGGNDTLQGNGVIGGAGRDTLIGTAFDDDLYGAELVEENSFDFTGGGSALATMWDEGNVYRGGAGNDVLWATGGSDVFEYGLGDGTDTVTDMLHDETFMYGYGGPIGTVSNNLPHWQDPSAADAAHLGLLFSSSDTLKFGFGIAAQDVQAFRWRELGITSDLLLSVGSGAVRFENWYTAQVNQLGRIEFADGTVWDAGTIAAKAAAAPSLVRGSEFDDFLFGGPQDEAFEGGEGNDTYFISPGGGRDRIVDSGGIDTLSIAADSSAIALGLGSLQIRIGERGDAVHLENFDPNDVLARSDIEIFRFADGTELSYAELVARGFDLFGTPGDDAIVGTDVVDRIDGGAGDDTLAGGLGSDTYRFGAGSGQDLIREASSALDSDTLEIFANPGEVAATRQADSIVVSLNAVDRAAIEWFADPSARIENVTFLDGTVWDAATLEAQIAGNTNQAPTVENPIADQNAVEDAPFIFIMPADVFGDVDANDVLAYATENLPAWLSFDPETRTFLGTPLNADVGTYEVRVSATDTGGLSAQDAFALAVANVNDAPSVAVPLQQRVFDADSPLVFALPTGTFADDDVGDALTLSAALLDNAPLPAWLAFNPATGTFSGAPQAGHIGFSHVVVTATDAAGESVTADFGQIVRAPPSATVSGGREDDFLYGNTGDETLKAKGGSDYLYGDAGDDLLKGGAGSDVLQGGDGDDMLRGGTGQNVLDGGAGNDVIHGGQGSGFLAGGAGNDVLRVGKGNDVIAFNLGDGIDTLHGGRDGGNTLSLGGGIGYDDLSFSKDGRDLVVSVGAADRLVLKNWYNGSKSVLNLQLILDASDEFDATSSDPLYNKKVQTFDFLGLVSAFDSARAASPGLTSWAVTNALLQFHLSGVDDLAIGGDLAYWYGKTRDLSGMNIAAAQQLIGTSNFGSEAQTLRPFSGLQEGFAKLA